MIVAIVLDSDAQLQDSAAEYVPIGHACDVGGAPGRIQPQRAAKLHRRVVVDAQDSTDPDPHPDPNSDTASGSGSGSDSGSGSGSQHDSDGSGTSSAVTVSSSDPEACPPQPPPKKRSAKQLCALHKSLHRRARCLPSLMSMQPRALPPSPTC